VFVSVRFYILFAFRSVGIVCYLNLIDGFSVGNGNFSDCFFDRDFLLCFYCLSKFRTNYALAIGEVFDCLTEGIKTVEDFVCYWIQHFDLHL
jgi:hypothetical protein